MLVGSRAYTGNQPDRIAQKLSGGFVKNPRVNIDVIHYRPVYVYGEVTRPGTYNLASETPP